MSLLNAIVTVVVYIVHYIKKVNWRAGYCSSVHSAYQSKGSEVKSKAVTLLKVPSVARRINLGVGLLCDPNREGNMEKVSPASNLCSPLHTNLL